MRTALKMLAVGVLALAAGGCLFHRASRDQPCAESQAYLHAESVPPVRAADGMSEPNTRNALKIADAPTAVKARMKSEGCLDQPPSFFPGRPKPGSKLPAPPPTAAPTALPVVPAPAADGAPPPAAPAPPTPDSAPAPVPK